jgi:hypothetical protein
MTRTALCGAIFSAALAVGVSAQTPAGQAGAMQDKQAPKAGAITVTGCLAPDTGAASGATGTTGTSGTKSEGYILKNVTASPAGAAASASPTASEYVLTGGNKADLKKYENSKVEIKGRVEDSKAPKSAPSGAAAGPESPRLHVDSVKQIAASCSN